MYPKGLLKERMQDEQDVMDVICSVRVETNSLPPGSFGIRLAPSCLHHEILVAEFDCLNSAVVGHKQLLWACIVTELIIAARHTSGIERVTAPPSHH